MNIVSGISVALLTFVAAPALAATLNFSGTAKTPDGKILYQEIHSAEGACIDGLFQPKSDQIHYRRPETGEVFASKALEYQGSVLRPVVDFRQPDFSESLNIRYPDPGLLVIDWQMPQGETRTFDVPYSSDVVVDAGFDNLVRRHWNELVNGQTTEFRFLGPTRGEHYPFVLEPTENADIRADYVFQIRPTGMVLRFLVDPIILGYNSSGALTDYLGLTNIRESADSNYTAHIRYSVDTWPECELTPSN
ncbi:hypothetical protein BKP64_05270 [Marinobacter salinus]|uniref:Uncharacterized protein n=1 Tax=Marinobacter salinus TaxID=1874317 RepID=A0A1D9GJ10_9GAMM|nr:hypothetical protein [Marinobacter salinus]AOY87627.1 hypothetical protein BKP64_05270 [Marinobacter salinus]